MAFLRVGRKPLDIESSGTAPVMTMAMRSQIEEANWPAFQLNRSYDSQTTFKTCSVRYRPVCSIPAKCQRELSNTMSNCQGRKQAVSIRVHLQ